MCYVPISFAAVSLDFFLRLYFAFNNSYNRIRWKGTCLYPMENFLCKYIYLLKEDGRPYSWSNFTYSSSIFFCFLFLKFDLVFVLANMSKVLYKTFHVSDNHIAKFLTKAFLSLVSVSEEAFSISISMHYTHGAHWCFFGLSFHLQLVSLKILNWHSREQNRMRLNKL